MTTAVLSSGSGTEMIVSGLNAEFGRLNWKLMDSSPYTASSKVYEVLLGGDDTVEPGTNATKEGFSIQFAADGTWAATFCGDDKIRGDVGEPLVSCRVT